MENKNIFTTFADMQKQAAENIANATENFQKTFLSNNQMNFDSEFFKKWYDSQMAWFNQNTKATENNPMNFFNEWMNGQLNTAKQWTEMTQEFWKNQNNGMMNADMNQSYNNMMGLFNNWMTTMNSSYTEMLNQLNNNNGKNTFEGMFNNAQMFMKAFEMWMPMMKSLNDKSFNMDNFKTMFNTELFKNFMDNMFNMQPDYLKNMMNSSLEQMKNNMGNMMDMNKNAFDQMKNAFAQQMPNGANMAENMLNQYNNWYQSVQTAVAPLTRLMPNGNAKMQAEAMQEIANQLAVYNMKNSQMQYIMYNTGMNAMNELAEELYTAMRNGENVESFTKVYQKMLNKFDTHFVKLFETEAYSKMMSETSALQLRIKKHMENMMEKAMSHLPLINRTEMDELYKTIHELKKRVHTLEKQLDNDTVVADEVKETKAAAKKTAKNA